ncbi:Decaprenyl diphosphate synthase-like protein [Pholiota molesta]|nr:Decaprenyl diphosphate synthase-like protein [Pholiota molesta]
MPQTRSLAATAYLWLSSKITNSAISIMSKVVSIGPMPRHIAFIMDGNRRYARMHGIPESQAHTNGYYQLSYLMGHWLNRTNVECVSIYGWSILNFGRKESEVADAMKLMTETLEDFATLCVSRGLDELEKHGVRVSFLGRIELLPLLIQEGIAKIHNRTRNHNRCVARFMNIYLAYTSSDEMARSIEACVNSSIKDVESITPMAIKLHLDTFHGNDIPMPPVDILVRTSGAKRFSDFFLWQACSNTQLQFVPTLWPAFGLRDLLPIILDFQRAKMYHNLL